ncbi:GvpL/GvpF family gas vesicle protein [Streptomyces bikiniensis]|uniref:GvpL/GvpF family gas vesicle protein n=1 Tax=Streptomyces bikiniensis TaxID=1896 RepID=UPI0004C0633D|nr:GvpL/GvpF family gas vesicle protein [Streptomyces bikiniensis]
MNAREDLTYVYAAVPDTREVRASLGGLRGVSGAPVSLLAAGTAPVAFVVSRVAPDEFDERTLKARFEDLEWLEGVARAHHEVVQTVARHDTVLPLRLATVYQNDDRARRALTDQSRAFTERIALLRGRSEFGVKLYVSPAGSTDRTGRTDGAESREGAADDASLTPGKAYLRRRRAQHSAQETRYRYAQEAAARVEALAPRFSTHRVRHPAQTGALAGPEENVLNDAYLVPHDRAEEFRTALAAAVEGLDGVRVEVTGPWAPYSFATPSPPSGPGAAGEGAAP